MTLDSLLFDGVDILSLRGIQDDMSQFGYVGTVALPRKNVTMTLLVVITDSKNN